GQAVTGGENKADQAWTGFKYEVGQAWNGATDHAKDIVGVASDVGGGVATGVDKAREAAGPVVSKLSAALRAGSSIGGKYLKPVARLSRSLDDVPGLGEAAIFVSVTAGLLSGQSPQEVGGGTLGAIGGGVAGAVAA